MIAYTGTVLHFDGLPDITGEIFDEDTAIELPSELVPVVFEFRPEPEFLLGKAKLFFEPGKLRFHIEFDDKRLTKDFLDPLVPCVGGRTLSRRGNKIEHVYVYSVGLTESCNADKRIKPIGEQE